MSGVRVLEVDELGRDAVIVRVDGEKLVFIDVDLDHDAAHVSAHTGNGSGVRLMSAHVVDHGDYMTIDVAGLSAELVDTLQAHMRVMESMTVAEWAEGEALDDQGRSDWLKAHE